MSAATQTPDTAGTVFDATTAELARNYADALLNAAGTAGDTDAVLDDLEAIGRDVLGAHPQFAAILQSPTTSIAEKDRILVEAFEGKANPTVVRFLRVLNRHGRLPILMAFRCETAELRHTCFGIGPTTSSSPPTPPSYQPESFICTIHSERNISALKTKWFMLMAARVLMQDACSLRFAIPDSKLRMLFIASNAHIRIFEIAAVVI